MATNNEFGNRISHASVPLGSICEYCGKPATLQHFVNGGRFHQNNPLLCAPCGQEFDCSHEEHLSDEWFQRLMRECTPRSTPIGAPLYTLNTFEDESEEDVLETWSQD